MRPCNSDRAYSEPPAVKMDRRARPTVPFPVIVGGLADELMPPETGFSARAMAAVLRLTPQAFGAMILSQ